MKNRSKLCLAYLLVYLTALVGGALHHHAHEGTAAAAADRAKCCYQALHPSDDDDEGTCTVCLFLHQAQERAPSVAVVAADVHVEPALGHVILTALTALPSWSQARAPPIG